MKKGAPITPVSPLYTCIEIPNSSWLTLIYPENKLTVAVFYKEKVQSIVNKTTSSIYFRLVGFFKGVYEFTKSQSYISIKGYRLGIGFNSWTKIMIKKKLFKIFLKCKYSLVSGNFGNFRNSLVCIFAKSKGISVASPVKLPFVFTEVLSTANFYRYMTVFTVIIKRKKVLSCSVTQIRFFFQFYHGASCKLGGFILCAWWK